MKKKFIVATILALFLSIGASINAEAGPWCRRGYYRPHPRHAYYAPRPRVYYAPSPRPVVIVPAPRPYYRHHRNYGYSYGYRPRYYGHRRW